MTEVEAEALSEATLVETQPLDEAYETQVESQDMQLDTNRACLFSSKFVVDVLTICEQESETAQDLQDDTNVVHLSFLF